MNPDPLAQLRDIHLPETVSWWPPAPGWWLLALLLLTVLACVLWWWRRRRARLYFRGQAHQLLQTCWRDYQRNARDRVFVDSLFEILKRARRSSERNRSHGADGYRDSRARDNTETNELLSTMGMFKLLDSSTQGKLGEQVNSNHIEQLLYQPQAEALNHKQCQALYQAARRYLKQVPRQC